MYPYNVQVISRESILINPRPRNFQENQRYAHMLHWRPEKKSKNLCQGPLWLFLLTQSSICKNLNEALYSLCNESTCKIINASAWNWRPHQILPLQGSNYSTAHPKQLENYIERISGCSTIKNPWNESKKRQWVECPQKKKHFIICNPHHRSSS
jgi:hypothetical protein